MKFNKLKIKILEKKSEVRVSKRGIYEEYPKENNLPFLEVMYNPTTLDYSKEIKWIDSGDRGSELRQKQYDIIKFKKLTMQLLFDFTMDNSKIFEYYFDFFELISSENVFFSKNSKNSDDSRKRNLYRPPLLKLTWGKMIGIPNNLGGVYIVTKIHWSHKMFDREGKVLRATADITFEQIRRYGTEEAGDKERRVSANTRALSKAFEKGN